MMENGLKDKDTDMEFGRANEETLTLENGNRERQMDMECIHGLTVTSILLTNFR